MRIGWDLYVFCSKSLLSLVADNRVVTVAYRRRQGVDIHA